MTKSFRSPALSIDLTGQVALITGASSGLGWRFAEVLAAAGATVAVTGRRIDRLRILEKEINDRGGRALALELDACDPASISACVRQVEDQLGLISILINNAAMLDNQPAETLSLTVANDLIETNFRGPFLLCAEVGRRLIEAKSSGRIVNISSVGAYNHPVGATNSLYNATKSAIRRLTEGLAVEWASHNINVNAIAPGLFRTEMSEEFMRSEAPILASFPRKRAGEPHQLDSTLLYLVAPASEFVTGVCILVDDGQFGR